MMNDNETRLRDFLQQKLTARQEVRAISMSTQLKWNVMCEHDTGFEGSRGQVKNPGLKVGLQK
jgi:hypothetical protein